MTHERSIHIGKVEGHFKPYYFRLSSGGEMKEYRTKEKLFEGVAAYLQEEFESFD